MPFKTLILSPSESKAGRCLSLRSGGAKYTVRLKEPIEEQDGFVWLPYEVVFRRGTIVRLKVSQTVASRRLDLGRILLRSPPVLPHLQDRRCESRSDGMAVKQGTAFRNRSFARQFGFDHPADATRRMPP